MADNDLILKAKQVKSIYEPEWMALEEVAAVGIGMIKEEPVIIISTKTAGNPVIKKIPAEIDGVPVKVEVTGEFSAD